MKSARLTTILLTVVLGASVQAGAPVKLAGPNVCYEPGHKKYDSIKVYRSFDTLEQCIKAGGRKTKGKYA